MAKMTEQELESLRCTNMVLYTLRDKKTEKIRHERAARILEQNMTNKYMIKIVSTMYELLTKFKVAYISDPVSGNGFLANNGYHTILYHTIELSCDEKYIKIEDNCGNFYVFPVDVFKYSHSIKKRDKIFRDFLDRCQIVKLQHAIGYSNKNIKMYDKAISEEIKNRNKNVAKLDRLTKKKVEPLYLTEIKFDSKKGDEHD